MLTISFFACPCGPPTWSTEFFIQIAIAIIVVRVGFPKKGCCSFGFCPNYLLPPSPQFGQGVKLFLDAKNANAKLMKRCQKIRAVSSPPLIWTKSKRTAAFFRNPSLILITGLLIRGENWLVVVVVVVRQSWSMSFDLSASSYRLLLHHHHHHRYRQIEFMHPPSNKRAI